MSEEAVRVITEIAELLTAEDVVKALEDEPGSQRVLRGMAKLVEPDFETVLVGPPHLGTAQLEYRGADGFREAWLEWTEAYSSYRIEVAGMDDGPEAVFTLARQIGTTRTGGVEVEVDAAAVWWVRNGKLRRVEFHLDTDLARKAAGLD